MENSKQDRGEQTESWQTSLTEAALRKFVGPDAVASRSGRFNSPGSEKFSGTWNGGSSDVGSSDSAASQGSGPETNPNARPV